MTDLQETPIPVTDTGSNPPENPFGWNPFAEQAGTSQPQEIIPEQSTPAVTPDLSSIQQNTQVESNWSANGASMEAPQNTANNLADSQAMINAAKKDKLTQLLKAEQEKWKKAWFTKWLLSWIAVTACVLAVAVVFAKEQIIDFLSDGATTPVSLEASVVDLTAENVDEENIDGEDVNTDETVPADDETVPADDETVPADDETVPADDETVPADDETVPADDETVPADDETVPADDETVPADDETVPADDEAVPADDGTVPADDGTVPTDDLVFVHDWYTIRHVSSESEANWILPAHCSDLTCYWDNEEFVACTKFRADENLEETSQRIWSSGACKYKDPSELVYVEFNQ